MTWYQLRAQVLQALKLPSFRAPGERRPRMLASEDVPEWKAHVKLLRTLAAHSASVMNRVWSGIALTQDRKHRIFGEGREHAHVVRPLHHLIWRCRCISEADLPWWGEQEDIAAAKSLICMRAKGREYHSAWRVLCKWAIHVLVHREKEWNVAEEGNGMDEHLDTSVEDSPSVPVCPTRSSLSFPRETRGHAIFCQQESGYVYCGKCYISKRLRDHVYVATKACKAEHNMCATIGTYVSRQAHCGRVCVTQWKRASWRPRFVCIFDVQRNSGQHQSSRQGVNMCLNPRLASALMVFNPFFFRFRVPLLFSPSPPFSFGPLLSFLLVCWTLLPAWSLFPRFPPPLRQGFWTWVILLVCLHLRYVVHNRCNWMLSALAAQRLLT